METSGSRFSSVRSPARLAIGLVALLCFNAAQATNQLAGQISGLSPPDGRPCAFFSFEGVAQVDPSMPGLPWIVVRQSQNGFKEIYAFLLAARLSGQTVNVQTTGVAVPECDGYTGLAKIWLSP